MKESVKKLFLLYIKFLMFLLYIYACIVYLFSDQN